MDKVDVIISAFGKPWQTLCTLKSLMHYSAKHIDKIYLIEERFQAWNDSVGWITAKFDNIIHFIPTEYYGVASFRITEEQLDREESRLSFRFQYGIEKSDKTHVFLTHTDVLYTGDIIGSMLQKIEENTGIGLIGQCWNCSGFTSGNCDGDRYDKVSFTHSDVKEMMNNFPPARYDFIRHLNIERVMPLPECRLNDFACIINRIKTIQECYPNGNVPLFGSVEILDTGCIWFREMCYRGHKFINYDISKESEHGYFSPIRKSYNTSGYYTQLDEKLYRESEDMAKAYYEKNIELWEKK